MALRRVLLLLAVIIFVHGSTGPIKITDESTTRYPLGRRFTMEEAKQVCSKLDENHAMIRCKDPSVDYGRVGKQFLKKAGVRGKDVVLNPVVFVPGFGGSGLEAKLDKIDSPAWYCFKTYDWFRIWLALSELFVQDCWTENMQLRFFPNNNTYENTYGVQIRGIDFGGTSGIDYLDYVFGFPLPFTSVYAAFVESLESAGYTKGVNIRGVPYDFRLPPDDHMGELYPAMQKLIEDTYTQNNNMKVHVVSHSMGGPIFVFFMNHMTQEWKDKYIASFIPIAGPWAGASKVLRSVISGDDLGISFMDISLINKLRLRNVARNSGGLVSLMPDPLFWDAKQVFVRTATKNYTVNDIGQLLNDIGAPLTATIYEDVGHILPSMKAPFVPTHCIYGTNFTTELSYYYPDNNFDVDPIIEYTPSGDGTVPERSLEECTNWNKEQPQSVETKEFDLREHLDILNDEEVIEYVLALVTAPPSK